MSHTDQMSFLDDGRGQELRPRVDKELVVLLDLNHTLVLARGAYSAAGNFEQAILRETYDNRLVKLVQGHTVVLMTVRTETMKDFTLAHIANLTSWSPDEAHFNDTEFVHGGLVKAEYMQQFVLPKYGMPWERDYFAIESDAGARKYYRRLAIRATRVDREWVELPYYGEPEPEVKGPLL